MLAGGSSGFDASHGRIDAQLALLGERGLTSVSPIQRSTNTQFGSSKNLENFLVGSTVPVSKSASRHRAILTVHSYRRDTLEPSSSPMARASIGRCRRTKKNKEGTLPQRSRSSDAQIIASDHAKRRSVGISLSYLEQVVPRVFIFCRKGLHVSCASIGLFG